MSPRFFTDSQLAQMGLVRCKHNGCRIWIDPINLKREAGYCIEHHRQHRANQKPRTNRQDAR